MKKIWLSVLTGMMMMFFNSLGFAAYKSYSFTPNASDLYDLNHDYAYTWAINVKDSSIDIEDRINFETEYISGASLLFDDIRNWNYYESNKLWVSVLDINSSNGTVTQEWDNSDSGDYFEKNKATYDPNPISLFELIDLHGSSHADRTADIIIDITNDERTGDLGDDYVFSTAILTSGVSYEKGKIDMPAGAFGRLMTYASDGIFGLAFDPDCKFYNAGITLTLYTELKANAAPEPATLMLFGAGLLGLASKMRKKTNIA